MARIIALCGISGVGKTYLRSTDPRLKDFPHIDIADIYEEEPEGSSNRQIFALMLDRVENMIEQGEDVIVLEAYFRRGSYQRQWLEFLADRWDARVEYIELEAPLEVCIQRIKAQLEAFKKQPGVAKGEVEKMERYTSARLEILQSYQCA